MEKRLTEERGGELRKRRQPHGTEGLRIRTNFNKVSVLTMWLALLIIRINVLNRTSPNASGL